MGNGATAGRGALFLWDEARVGRILQENGRSLGLLRLLGLGPGLGEPCIIAVSHGGKEHGQEQARDEKRDAVQAPDMGRRGQFVRGVFGRLPWQRLPEGEAGGQDHGAGRITGNERGRRSAIDRDREQGARLERHDSKADPVCGARIVLDPIALGLKDADEFFPDGLPGLVRWALDAKDVLAGRYAKADDAAIALAAGATSCAVTVTGVGSDAKGAQAVSIKGMGSGWRFASSPTFATVTATCALPTPLMRTARVKTLSASKPILLHEAVVDERLGCLVEEAVEMKSCIVRQALRAFSGYSPRQCLPKLDNGLDAVGVNADGVEGGLSPSMQ